MEDEIDIKEYLSIIIRQWKIIVLVVILALGGAMMKTAKETPIYEVKTTIMVRSSSGGNNSGLLSSLSGLAGLNIQSGSGSMNDLMELIKSRAVAAKVLSDLNLRQRIKGWENPNISDQSLVAAVQGMLKKPDISGNLTTLTFAYSNKGLVADIANGYADALGYYWNQLNYTEAKRKREYIEAQLPRVEKELDIARQTLKKVNKEMNREMNLFNSSNQQASNQSAGNQAAIVSQIYNTSGGNPSSGLEIEQYAQEYNLRNSIYMMLKNQYEQVKLDESKETPPFLVIDKAMKPESDWQPQTKRNLMVGLLVGLAGGIFMAFFVNYLSKALK